MVLWLSVIAVGVVAVICWNLYRRAGASRIEALTDKRRASSRMVSGAELVEGSRHLKVAMALTNTDLFYENADMQASLDLQWIHEVEYDNCLSTGAAVEGGKVLRIRCFGQLFEFILPNDLVPRWHMMLPPRRRADAPVAVTA
jgi:hypothetical protein